MGSPLTTFTDFVNATGPSFITGPDDVLNEAVKQSYLLGRFLKGADKSKVLSGGSTIKDQVIFDEQSTATYYEPNDTFTWENPQVLTEWEARWKFLVDHMSWTDQEIELQGLSNYSQASRHQVYKRIKRSKEQRMWTSMINKMEDQLFRVPTVADMETSTGKQPYSIPAFVNEELNGLFGGVATGAPGAAWTTVEGINPVTDSKWVNQFSIYSSAAVSTGAANIVAAFDQMFYKVKFQAPPTKQEYFENTNLYSQFIVCSRGGLNVYQRLLRDYQDTFVTASRQDGAYISPQYAGIDLVYATSLDTAALYQAETASGALVVENTAAGTGEANGPRYYWLNSQYLCPVFHTSRYMVKHGAKEHPNQPFTTIVPVDCWMNLVARSRQRLGIVTPSADAGAADTLTGNDVYTAAYVPV